MLVRLTYYSIQGDYSIIVRASTPPSSRAAILLSPFAVQSANATRGLLDPSMESTGAQNSLVRTKRSVPCKQMMEFDHKQGQRAVRWKTQHALERSTATTVQCGVQKSTGGLGVPAAIQAGCRVNYLMVAPRGKARVGRHLRSMMSMKVKGQGVHLARP